MRRPAGVQAACVSILLWWALAVVASPCRALTISASPTVVPSGGLSHVVAHIPKDMFCDDWPVHTVEFTVTGPGTVNPGTDETSSATGDAETWFTADPMGYGKATVTARDLDNPGAAPKQVDIHVIRVTVGEDPIWWFNEVTPPNYQTSTTLTADGEPGTYVWTVVSGPVGLGPNKAGSYTGATVLATSTGMSSPFVHHDVSISLSWNSYHVTNVLLEVLSPNSFLHLNDRDWGVFRPGLTGYESDIWYACLDQYGAVLPRRVDINESWTGDHESDTAGETWSRPPEEPGVQVDPSLFADYIWVIDTHPDATLVPEVQIPQTPRSLTKVDHWPQRWRVGSAYPPNGRVVRDDRFQRYRDHARHE